MKKIIKSECRNKNILPAIYMKSIALSIAKLENAVVYSDALNLF